MDMQGIMEKLASADPSQREGVFSNEIANIGADSGPSLFQKGLGSIGGASGAFTAAGKTLAALASGLATPSYNNTLGQGFAAAAGALPGALEESRGMAREKEMYRWIDSQLEDPALPDDERSMLQAARGGNMPLAELQARMSTARSKALSAGLPKKPTAAELRKDRQRRSVWEVSANERGYSRRDLKNRNTPGTLDADAAKQFLGESDEDFQNRVRYMNDVGDRLNGDSPFQRVKYSDWLANQAGRAEGGGSGEPAGEILKNVAGASEDDGFSFDDFIPDGLLPVEKQLYESLGIQAPPSSDSFADRVFGGTPVEAGLEAVGTSAMNEASASSALVKSIMGYFGGGESGGDSAPELRSRQAFEADPNARRSTLRREESLRGGGITDLLGGFDNREEDLSGIGNDPYLQGRKARQDLLNGGSQVGTALRNAPSEFMSAIERALAGQ